jgi:chromosome segregation ATPase
MEIQELTQELEEHRKKFNDLITRKYKIEQIIQPHRAELEFLRSDISYESGIIDALEATIKKYNKPRPQKQPIVKE